MKATIEQQRTGCTITDDNWNEEILNKFLKQGWKIIKEKNRNENVNS